MVQIGHLMNKALFLAAILFCLFTRRQLGVEASFANPNPVFDKSYRWPKCFTSNAVANAAVKMVPALNRESTVVDLGSGTGALLLAAVDSSSTSPVKLVIGYELDEELVKESTLRAAERGLEDKIKVKKEDLWQASEDLKIADAVFVRAVNPVMIGLEEYLYSALKPGAYILSIDNPLPRSRLLHELSVTTGKDDLCPEKTVDYTLLFLYQVPLDRKDRSRFQIFLAEGVPTMNLRYFDFGENALLSGVYRQEICTKHKRATCVEFHLLTKNNIATTASISLDSYRELLGQRLQLEVSDSAEGVAASRFSTILDVKINQDDMEKHGPHMYFYTFDLPEAIKLTKDRPSAVLRIHLHQEVEPNPHLYFYYQADRLDQVRDGSYDLVAYPRSLGMFFTVWLQGNTLSVWARRHGRLPPTHIEVFHNGDRVINELMDPGTPTGSVGFMHAYQKLERTPTETLGFKAVLIEPAKALRYTFEVPSWNRTLREISAPGQTKEYSPSEVVTARTAVSVPPAEEAPAEAKAAADKKTSNPDIKLRFFDQWSASAPSTASSVGVEVVSTKKLSGTVLMVWYAPDAQTQSFALECYPEWDEDRAKSHPQEAQVVCKVFQGIPKDFGIQVDTFEVDLWVDPATEQKPADALGPFHAWLANAGTDFVALDPAAVLAPRTLGLTTTMDLETHEAIFSIPPHLVIRPHCILCRHDWYQRFFDDVMDRSPCVHYALEMAKVALYSLNPSVAPFHTDEFVHFLSWFDQVRKVQHQRDVQGTDSDRLPMERFEPSADIDLQRKTAEEIVVEKVGLAQNKALVAMYRNLTKYPESQWFQKLFPEPHGFVHFVAQTSKLLFPELHASPVLSLFELSANPTAKFYTDSNNITVQAAKKLSASDPLTLGCNALYHLMWLFKGQQIARRLGRDGIHPGSCQGSVLMENGLVLSRSEQSPTLVDAYYAGDRAAALQDLRALLQSKDGALREIIEFNIARLSGSGSKQ